jgi:hypothetical protein
VRRSEVAIGSASAGTREHAAFKVAFYVCGSSLPLPAAGYTCAVFARSQPL